MQRNIRVSKSSNRLPESTRVGIVNSKIVSTQSLAKRGSDEAKITIDSDSDGDGRIAHKKSDLPVSERVKDAAMHVLRSSRSLGSKSRELSGGLKKQFKDDLPSTSSSVAAKPSNVPMSQSSAFQPIKKPTKVSTVSIGKSNPKDSKQSVRDRQRAYDAQVRKMNWKPLSVERPPPEPQPVKDAELMKSAQMEIFFPRNFGVPEDNLISSDREPVVEMKTLSVSPLSENYENIPQPNIVIENHPFFINPNFDILKKEKVQAEAVAFVPARRPTKPVQLPALLRASMDPNRKSFVKPKEIEIKPQQVNTQLPTSKSKKKKISKSQKIGKKKSVSKSLPANKFDPTNFTAPIYGIEHNDNVNVDDYDEDLGEFEFSSDGDEQSQVSDVDSSDDLGARLIEVPQIRLSLSERLNTYLGSRDVSILSENASVLTGNAYSMNPVAKKTIEQALAFGTEPVIETVKQKREIPRSLATERINQPSKNLSQKPVKEFSKPISVAQLKSINGVSSEQTQNILYAEPRIFPKSHYDPADDSDDVNIMSRLRLRGINYHPYESGAESTGSLFGDEQRHNSEFEVHTQKQDNGVRRKPSKDEVNKKPAQTDKNREKTQVTKPSKRYHEDPYRSSLASSFGSFPQELRNNFGIDLEALKDQIKREIEAERAEAQAVDKSWDEFVPALSIKLSKSQTAPTAGTSNVLRDNAYRLRLEIMEELRRQDGLFQYTLDLHELQNEMLQQQTHPTMIVPKRPQVAAEASQEVIGHANATQQWLEAANLNLFSTDQTILESEKLLSLYREIQEQQNRTTQLHQQQKATLYNSQTRPVLHTFQQSMELRPTENALIKLQKVEQRQKERMAWLDHVIRMHLSTSAEAEEERAKIDELHRVELEQLRQSLRDSRGKAIAGDTVSVSVQKEISGDQTMVPISSSRLEVEDSDQEVSDRGRSFLRMSLGYDDDVLLEDNDYFLSPESNNKLNYGTNGSSSVRYHEENDQVLADEQFPDKDSNTTDSHKKSFSDVNASHYYSLSEEEAEEEHNKMPQHKSSDFNDDHENYRDEFEVSESYDYARHSSERRDQQQSQNEPQLFSQFIRSDVSFVEKEHTQDYMQDNTQEISHKFTQEYIPEESDANSISQTHDTAEVSEEEIRDSHEWIHGHSKQVGNEREAVEERALNDDEIVDEEIIPEMKSTQSIVYEEEDDFYEDDFVASRSHSHITLPKSVSAAPVQSKGIDYRVDDVDVEVTKDKENDNHCKDTFLSVQQSKAYFPKQQVDLGPVSVSEPPEDSIAYEEEYEFEPDNEDMKSADDIQTSKAAIISSTDENMYADDLYEFSKGPVPLSAPLTTAIVITTEDAEISVKDKENDEFEEEEELYEDDFVADASRSSSFRHWPKFSSEPSLKPEEMGSVTISKAQQEEENEVIEEIESKLEEEEDEEKSEQQGIAKSNDNEDEAVNKNELVSAEYCEEEVKFEDDFEEEESVNAAVTVPVVELPDEEYDENVFDAKVNGSDKEYIMDTSNMAKLEIVTEEPNITSTAEKDIIDVEVVPDEVEEEDFDLYFENHDEEDKPIRATIAVGQKPYIPVVKSAAHHAIIMDEDEDGALILDDDKDSGDLSGVELRKRLIHAATRSSDSHHSTFTQQMSSPLHAPLQPTFSSSTSSISSPMSPPPGVTVNIESRFAASNKVGADIVTTAPVMTRVTSSGSMRYDPDAQRWVGGEDISLAGFSSTSSSSPRHSSHTSPKTSTAASVVVESENEAAADTLLDSEDECFAPNKLSQSSLLIMADEEEGLVVESSDKSWFEAEKEDTYIPIVRKAASFAAAVTTKPVEAPKPRVFEDDLEAFLDDLDDDDEEEEEESREKDIVVPVVSAVSPQKEATNVSNTDASEPEVEGNVSSSFVINEDATNNNKIEMISDLLVDILVRDAFNAAQQMYPTSALPIGVEDAPILLEANTSSFLLDESQSFAHSSQDDSQQHVSVPIAMVPMTAAEADEEDVILQKSVIDESQSIILASYILDEEDDSRQTSSTSASSLLLNNISQQNVTTNTSINTSVVLAQLDQQSPLTTLDDAMRIFDTFLSLLDFDLVHQQLVSTSSPTLPPNFLQQCISQRHFTTTLKDWQRQVHFDRLEATLRAIHRIHHTDVTAASAQPRLFELVLDDDDLDPLIVHVFQPASSAMALKHFVRHHLQQEIAGFYSLDNPHYLQRLLQHQQATISAAANLSNTNNIINNQINTHLNSSNVNTSMQSLHSQLSQTLQQAQQAKPQVRHWDWSIYDHGAPQRIIRHTHSHIDRTVEHLTDVLMQRLVVEAVTARQKHQS